MVLLRINTDVGILLIDFKLIFLEFSERSSTEADTNLDTTDAYIEIGIRLKLVINVEDQNWRYPGE